MAQFDYPTAFSLWGEEEQAAIARVLESGRFTMGPEVEAFEAEFAEYHGRRHAIMVNSGSSANLIAVAALFAKETDPLRQPHAPVMIWTPDGRGTVVEPARPLPDLAIAPAIAWSTTYAPLIQHGLAIDLADVDETWNAPVPAVYARTNLRLIVTAPILGNPHYASDWKPVADTRGAYMIEDCCESLGALHTNGTLVGTTGIMATFSFFYSHQVSAIEGGAILTDDDECAKWCRILRAHGWTRDVKAPATFDEEYDFVHFGYNVRPLELHAAIARAQLPKLFKFQAQRIMNEANFRTHMVGKEVPITFMKANGGINPFGIAFLCESQAARKDLVWALRTSGIDCRLPTGGSFRMHRYGMPWRHILTPKADAIHERGLFLGNAPFDIKDKVERAAEIVVKVLKGRP